MVADDDLSHGLDAVVPLLAVAGSVGVRRHREKLRRDLGYARWIQKDLRGAGYTTAAFTSIRARRWRRSPSTPR